VSVKLTKGVVVADRFRLEHELGRGGMGDVWRAHQLALDVPCAIKFIHAHWSESHTSRARFQLEARAAARLRSSHVVQILDHGVWESIPYIAMELLEGETLAARLTRVGRITLEQTCAIATQIAHALGKAEEAGIIHRDLKPENIFLTGEGGLEVVKVLDFGVAKLTKPEERGSVSTKTGQLVGTPNYLSPEQAHGAKDIDHRSDLYALALIVFECVTGQLAFSADGIGALLNEIMQGELPRPSRHNGALPAGLDAWFARAAARDPGDRFDSAHAMIAGLAELAGVAAPELVRPERPGVARDAPTLAAGEALSATLPRGAPGESGGSSAPPLRVRAAAAAHPSQMMGTCRAADGVRLAYAKIGSGPPLVKTANWLSHLERDRESPIWTHWLDFLGSGRTFVRYDARGNGLSDWDVGEIDFERFVGDLETVLDACGIERAPLLGISQGAAVATAFAARHPERVSGLVLIGGCARGWRAKGRARLTEQFSALVTLMRTGWGQDNPVFRQIFTSSFFPGGSAEELRYFDELQRSTTSPDNAARILSALGDVDIREELPKVKAPTLVLHSTGDRIIPMSDGMELAAGIAGARFVSLDSANHLYLAHEPAWERLREETARFFEAIGAG
jgi:pimeloyl-ACP methyl ester carboxylesterase